MLCGMEIKTRLSGESVLASAASGGAREELWAQARAWVGRLLALFDRTVLRTTGIRRAHGAQLSLWLMQAEAGLRRLILAAALMMTPPGMRQGLRHEGRTPRVPARPRAFRIFGLRGAGGSRPQARVARPPCPYGHLRFPGDPLLRLGEAAPSQRSGHNGGPLLPRLRPPHPLDRHGRLSRQDPDWRAPPERERPALFVTVSEYPRCAPRPKRTPYDPEALPDSLHDWRRCYDEWQKLVPAPALAARLDVIERIAAHPAAAIARTARRLGALRERIRALARLARPPRRLPRRAIRRTALVPDGGGARFAAACHAALDSS